MPDIVHVACKLATGIQIGSVAARGTAYNPEEGVPELVGGFRITMNVPKAEWDRWYDGMKDSDLITQNLVFADKNLAVLRKRASENKKVPGSMTPMAQPK